MLKTLLSNLLSTLLSTSPPVPVGVLMERAKAIQPVVSNADAIVTTGIIAGAATQDATPQRPLMVGQGMSGVGVGPGIGSPSHGFPRVTSHGGEQHQQQPHQQQPQPQQLQQQQPRRGIIGAGLEVAIGPASRQKAGELFSKAKDAGTAGRQKAEVFLAKVCPPPHPAHPGLKGEKKNPVYFLSLLGYCRFFLWPDFQVKKYNTSTSLAVRF